MASELLRQAWVNYSGAVKHEQSAKEVADELHRLAVEASGEHFVARRRTAHARRELDKIIAVDAERASA